jgi:hypothetical protein
VFCGGSAGGLGHRLGLPDRRGRKIEENRIFDRLKSRLHGISEADIDNDLETPA